MFEEVIIESCFSRRNDVDWEQSSLLTLLYLGTVSKIVIPLPHGMLIMLIVIVYNVWCMCTIINIRICHYILLLLMSLITSTQTELWMHAWRMLMAISFFSRSLQIPSSWYLVLRQWRLLQWIAYGSEHAGIRCSLSSSDRLIYDDFDACNNHLNDDS